MAYYKEKIETGNEYVMATQNFYMYTLNKCMSLPQRWYEIILKPVINSAENARNYTVKANRIYIDPKVQSKEDYRKALEERCKLLTEALREFSVFDIAFSDLLSYVDLGNLEKNRIKSKLEDIIKEIQKSDPELKKIHIDLDFTENEMSFTSVAGKSSTKLKLTNKNVDYWMNIEMLAENKIKSRIANDKKIITKAKQ